MSSAPPSSMPAPARRRVGILWLVAAVVLTAVLGLDRNTLLLDVRAEPDYLRRLLHHEVFHFVDFADDGIVLADRRWEALNRTGFSYGHGGRDMRAPEATPMREDLPGFVSLHATSALEEEKAEIFAFMMARPDEMRRLAARDEVVAAKMAYVASVAPNVDESFWHALR